LKPTVVQRGEPTKCVGLIFVDDYGKPIPYVEVKIVSLSEESDYLYKATEIEKKYLPPWGLLADESSRVWAKINQEKRALFDGIGVNAKTNDVGAIKICLDDNYYKIYARKEGFNIYPDWTLIRGVLPQTVSWNENIPMYKIAVSKEEEEKLEEIRKAKGKELQKLIEEESKPIPKHGKVTFRVYDAYTKQPIAKARVEVNGYSAVTDSNGLAYIELDYKEYTVKVSANGYIDYSEKLYCMGEIGIALIPLETQKIPKPVLSVDKETVIEGEAVTFSVDPSNISVDLYEIVDNEYKFIKTFTGKTTLTISRGDHTFAVKYLYKYGSYTSEVWSNIVYVHGAVKPVWIGKEEEIQKEITKPFEELRDFLTGKEEKEELEKIKKEIEEEEKKKKEEEKKKFEFKDVIPIIIIGGIALAEWGRKK